MEVRGVIFDLDGTLGDTLPVCYAAYREVFQEYLGKTYTDAEIHALFGPDEEGIFRSVLPERWEAGLRAYLDAYTRLHPAAGNRIPGIDELLQHLSDQGVRLAVVTGKGAESTRISLRLLGLERFFAEVEPGSADGAVKPDAIARVLRRWGLQADEVLYVGDSPYDVRASRQAGVRAVAAMWASSADREALQATQPALCFDDVASFRRWLGSG